MQKEVLISLELPLIKVLNNHVPADCSQEWEYALLDDFLDVWPLDKGCEQLNELKGHSLDAMRLLDVLIFFRFISTLVNKVIFFITVVVVRAFFPHLFTKGVEILVVPLDFRKDREMTVHKLPSWSQDHVDAVSRVVNEVSKYHCQAFQCIPLDIEELVGICLNHLQEQDHPLVECLIQTEVNELVINPVCPTYSSET